MKLKTFIILLLGWSNSFSQRNSIIFEEKQADILHKKIDSILLIGSGSITTRIFLDDLSQSIMKSLGNNRIFANYYYLGKTPGEAQSAFDTISKKGYKAILFFLPKGEPFFDVQGGLNRTTTNTKIGPVSPAFATSRLDYQQDFNFLLCIPGTTMETVWSAFIGVSGDLGKSKAAKKVAAKLISYFKKNMYVR